MIKNGRVEITNAAEKILPAFVTDGHPRTAIAKLNSGQILLLTVDGRQPGESIGMSLTMLADLLLEFGAVACPRGPRLGSLNKVPPIVRAAAGPQKKLIDAVRCRVAVLGHVHLPD